MFPRHGKSLEIAFGWLSELSCTAFFLELVVFCCGKWSWAKNYVHSHLEHKSSFEVNILDTRSLPWAWGVTSVPCPLGSTHGLDSCKRSKRNQPIPFKPHFLNFPISHTGLGHASKNKIKCNTWIEPTMKLGLVELGL